MANHVLKVNASRGDTYLLKTLAALGTPPWFLEFRLWIPAATLAALTADFDTEDTSAWAYFGDYIFAHESAGGSWQSQSGYTGPAGAGITSGAWHTINAAIDVSLNVAWKLDGVLVLTDLGVSIDTDFEFGALFSSELINEIYYLDDLKIGTTLGGTDIFADDFEGTLAGWDSVGGSGLIAIVPETEIALPLTTITLAPNHGGGGSTAELSGANFGAGAPLTITFGFEPLGIGVTNADGAGAFSSAFVVPRLHSGPGVSYDVWVTDDQANAAHADWDMCLNATYDGIDYTVTQPMVGWTAGTFKNGDGGALWDYGTIFDYIHHAGAHWIVFGFDSAGSINFTAFPPDPNMHTLIVERIPDDGSAHTTYFVDTDYAYGWHVNDPGPYLFCQEWDDTVSFTGWNMVAYDAKFASDGTTLWLAVVAPETVAYPWLSTLDGTTPVGCHAGGYPSMATQFQPLSVLEATYAPFHRFVHHDSGLPSAGQSPPNSDGGDAYSGQYTPGRLSMFAFAGGGFAKLDTVEAKFYNYTTDGGWMGGVGVCASPAEPGVCHAIWSEGGGWGTRGNGTGGSGTGGTGLHMDVWDAGFPNLDYRINYSRWSSGGKTLDTDILGSHTDRSNWYYVSGGFKLPLVWVGLDDLWATNLYAVKNDHGSPVLFLTKFVTNGDGVTVAYTPDMAEPTIRMYDLSSGAAVFLQAVTADLLPQAGEAGPGTTEALPYQDMDRMFYDWGPQSFFSTYGMERCHGAGAFGFDAGFAITPLYHDATLGGGTDVYVLYAVWTNQNVPANGGGFMNVYANSFVRVPCDGSGPFSIMDGDRRYSVITRSSPVVPPIIDFVAEPRNVWVPGPGSTLFAQLDRSKCAEGWIEPGLPAGAGGAAPPHGNTALFRINEVGGFYYDPAGTGTIYFPAQWNTDAFDFVHLRMGAGRVVLCRDCLSCDCAPKGLHVWKRIGRLTPPS